MSKVNNKVTRTTRRSGIFMVNFEHFTTCSIVSIVNFEQVNTGWDIEGIDC